MSPANRRYGIPSQWSWVRTAISSLQNRSYRLSMELVPVLLMRNHIAQKYRGPMVD